MKLIYAGTPPYVMDLFCKPNTQYGLAPGLNINLVRVVRVEDATTWPALNTCPMCGKCYDN